MNWRSSLRWPLVPSASDVNTWTSSDRLSGPSIASMCCGEMPDSVISRRVCDGVSRLPISWATSSSVDARISLPLSSAGFGRGLSIT